MLGYGKYVKMSLKLEPEAVRCTTSFLFDAEVADAALLSFCELASNSFLGEEVISSSIASGNHFIVSNFLRMRVSLQTIP